MLRVCSDEEGNTSSSSRLRCGGVWRLSEESRHRLHLRQMMSLGRVKVKESACGLVRHVDYLAAVQKHAGGDLERIGWQLSRSQALVAALECLQILQP